MIIKFKNFITQQWQTKYFWLILNPTFLEFFWGHVSSYLQPNNHILIWHGKLEFERQKMWHGITLWFGLVCARLEKSNTALYGEIPEWQMIIQCLTTQTLNLITSSSNTGIGCYRGRFVQISEISFQEPLPLLRRQFPDLWLIAYCGCSCSNWCFPYD